MKIKLAVSDERADEIRAALIRAGFEPDEDADLILTERDRYVSHLEVRQSGGDGDRRILAAEDILFIESFGHTVEVHAKDGLYQTSDRLYQLNLMLDPHLFLRISNSVIVNRRQIRKITPTLSQKYILTMKNGEYVDVTRSYYSSFRSSLGI